MNAKRKADREAIAASFVAVAEKFGAEIVRRETPACKGFGGAGIDLSFYVNGVGASLSIDDVHGGEAGLISWYNDYRARRGARDFSPGFNAAVGEHGHPRPHHKATSFDRWDVLAARLQAGLRHAFNQTAFLD